MKVRYRILDFIGWPEFRVGTDGSVWTRLVQIHPGHGSYFVLGNQWKERKQATDKDGYKAVTFCVGNRIKGYRVHRLVLMAFVGPCPKGMVARHYPDHDPANNRLENLSWATQKKNLADRVERGTMMNGEKNHQSKMTAKSVRAMRNEWSDERPTVSHLSRKYGIARKTVRLIVHRLAWVWLD